MDLPDPDSYERFTHLEPESFGSGFTVCASCGRSEDVIQGNVNKHIMGCAFRSRYHAIAHYNYEQNMRDSYARVQAALKKLDGE